MAFYDNIGDFDLWGSTAYDSYHNYDHCPNPDQEPTLYSSPGFGEPQLIEYKSSAYYRDDHFPAPLESNYSVYTYSEPKVVQYDPTECYHSYNYHGFSVSPSEINYVQPKFLQYNPSPYDRVYFPSETKFTISYSSVEFNEPEFDEYDPTPYGGGYDPTTTYGKSLPPSDAICYPRTVPESDSISPENFSYSSIPSPYGKDEDLPAKPPIRSKPVETKPEAEAEAENHAGNADKVASDGKEVEIFKPALIESDDSTSSEDENGFDNGTRGHYGYESERVRQIPYGSGLEAMDLCESIFGYWPCLAKKAEQQRNKCQVCEQEREMDPWESAADYLFGSRPIVYGYGNYHHHHQPQYDYGRNSWLQ